MSQRVLLVEDEIMILMVVEMAFHEAGFEVVVASDGQMGLEVARAKAVDAIVTDYMMPGLDGIAMLTALRSEGIDVPAIMVTAISRAQLDVGETAPFDRHMVKPVDEDELVEAVRDLLRQVVPSEA
ncbi:response regulator [uncultured Jannaschia sp.]|uniref:response regulator transcription factor n=1 Tax=uncultured Jannaschia sp. TaxID=293347 RepID=UPI002635DDAF|nr:response regulator [uncultured Jannaschia sp.]